MAEAQGQHVHHVLPVDGVGDGLAQLDIGHGAFHVVIHIGGGAGAVADHDLQLALLLDVVQGRGGEAGAGMAVHAQHVHFLLFQSHDAGGLVGKDLPDDGLGGALLGGVPIVLVAGELGADILLVLGEDVGAGAHPFHEVAVLADLAGLDHIEVGEVVFRVHVGGGELHHHGGGILHLDGVDEAREAVGGGV